VVVYRPSPAINPVVQKLRDRGLYLGDLGNGKHQLVCPRYGSQLAGDEAASIYIEPDAAHPAGQYFCPHSHDDFSLRDLLADLGVSWAEARHRPTVYLHAGEINPAMLAMEAVLAQTGKFFHTGGTLEMLTKQPNGSFAVVPVTEQTLTQELSARIDFEKFDGRSKTLVRSDPPPRLVNMLLHKRDYHILPELKGLARQPYFGATEGGIPKLIKTSGYHKPSGLYAVFHPRDYDLPEPTLEEAQKCMELLKDLVSEFHFVAEVDRSVALAAIFTAVFRPSIPLAPGFHMRAPVIASGKSLLCDVIGAFAGPDGNTKISYPRHSEEATKVILSALLSVPAVLEFDDMDSDWRPHGVINRMFTSEHISDRILGVSKMATVGTRTLVLGSGNNVGPVRDLTRRVATCHLDPRCATPAALSYRKNPVELIRKSRPKYVGAVLTVVQAWLAAGSPKTTVPNIASFGGEWSDRCRHPLIWMGLTDPAEAFFDQLKNDPDVENLGRLLKAWIRVFGSKETTVRQMSANLHMHSDLEDAIAEFPVMERDSLNHSKLGWVLKRNANRIVDGLMFVRVEGSERTAWRVDRA
jgi:hypothetical protein